MTGDVELDGLRGHDLPPRWDGHPVAWSAWEPEPWTTMVFHVPDMGACSRCGSLAQQLTCRGTVTQDSADHTIHATQLRVTRCADCRHDVVVEIGAGGTEVWDLDATDYSNTGSSSPVERHRPGPAPARRRERLVANPARIPVRTPVPERQPMLPTETSAHVERVRALIRPTRSSE